MFGYDEPKTGNIQIVDGVQRISTLQSFLVNELELGVLETLACLAGFRYLDLPAMQQRRFRNRTLRMVVLSEKTDISTLFDVFERINTGSLVLTASELRKAAFPGEFTDFVKACAQSKEFMKVCPMAKRARDRGEGEELVLRFFEYSENYQEFKHDVARFLNEHLVTRNEEGF